ncbi:MAG: septum formation protein Maf [Deltaproteobacteria bacterium]|nr:septum formation protein Maf [Deltaproteobacteria bacterium]
MNGPQHAALILASASPPRRGLLSACGLDFEVIASGVDEGPLPREEPQQLVTRLAVAKARVVAEGRPCAWIVGADTVVVLDNEILGKPKDQGDAARMLSKLEGREHQVFGGVGVINRGLQIEVSFHSVSRVKFAPLSAADIRRYIESGEPLGKAGAYAIQGRGSALISDVYGSYTNVVGLDLAKLMGLLRDLGFFRSE